MRVPSNLKPVAWGAAGGVIGLAIVGFTLAGWVTGNDTHTMVPPSAGASVVRQFGPTHDTLFAPPDYPSRLSPRTAPIGSTVTPDAPQSAVAA